MVTAGQQLTDRGDVILALRRAANIPRLWVKQEMKVKPCVNVISASTVIKLRKEKKTFKINEVLLNKRIA